MSAPLFRGGKFVKKGAEADLYLRDWYGLRVIVKERVVKTYRVPALDGAIRWSRTVRESRLLHKAKLAGVATPIVLFIDLPRTAIIMEYVDGRLLKDILNEMPKEERIGLFQRIGRLIGRLHQADIVHGDLTTSNIIITPRNSVCFIDFGLSMSSSKLEDRAVDLHLMRTSLRSTHLRVADECFESLMDGYSEILGEASASVKKRIAGIERRFRYVRRADVGL
ncbi:MAG: Kae1-associated kinase Bud32 [Candidatus Bathyarchaeia archaeon]